MSKTDRIAAQSALANWLHSQDIEPGDAAYICAVVAGTIVAEMTRKNRARQSEAVALLHAAMLVAVHEDR